MTRLHRSAASSIAAAVLTGLGGFLAFNVLDGVFGALNAILGLMACIATTVLVFSRSPPASEEPDA